MEEDSKANRECMVWILYAKVTRILIFARILSFVDG